MGPDKKRERMAALFGIDIPTPEQLKRKDDRSREAEAVLAYYAVKPGTFIERTCKHCSKMFAVNRGSVAYCSDECRTSALAAIGIVWDPTKSIEERWSPGAEPLTVTPRVLEVMKHLATSHNPDVVEEQTEMQEASPQGS